VMGGVAVVAGLIIAAIVSIGFLLSPQDKLESADVIVAISGGETPQRTREAVKLYRNGYAPKVLFSGAAADHNGPSNAAAMRADALGAGVPDEDILIEEGSVSTADNAAKTAPLIEGLGAKKVILVTSPYHQQRASLNFRQILGPDITILNHSASDSVWRKSNWWEKPYTVGLTLAELQKTLYVWLTKTQSVPSP